MKVAAYQAPLSACGSMVEALALIRDQVEWCESARVEILCCPEGVLGGLADYATQPTAIAIDVEDGRLNMVLAPLASDTVTTILGFTEIDRQGRLYNSAAVFHKGSVAGVYRKLHPAINRSVYEAGREVPIFQVGELTFGVVICNDSNYPELARFMAAQARRVHGALPDNSRRTILRHRVRTRRARSRYRWQEIPALLGELAGAVGELRRAAGRGGPGRERSRRSSDWPADRRASFWRRDRARSRQGGGECTRRIQAPAAVILRA